MSSTLLISWLYHNCPGFHSVVRPLLEERRRYVPAAWVWMRLKAFHLVRNHSCTFSRGMSILLLLFELGYFTDLLLYFSFKCKLSDAVCTYFFQCTAWPFVFKMGIFWRKRFQYLWSSIDGSRFCLLAKKKSKPDTRFSRLLFVISFKRLLF